MVKVQADRPIRVLQSFRGNRETTNPYLIQLVESMPGDVITRYFTWRSALFGSIDVIHVHWPELMLRGSTGVKTLARQILMALLILRIRTTRTVLVRTLHNVEAHEVGGVVERALQALVERSTSTSIRLSAATPAPAWGTVVTILHGHYRRWFEAYEVPPALPGRLLTFGLIRPYKGIDLLLTAFSSIDDPAISLEIIGRPTTSEIELAVEALAARDSRVHTILQFIDDKQLAEQVGQAALVVLPYRFMHNSGAAVLALSLARPVLVPDTLTMRELSHEVGEGWVTTFAAPLTTGSLQSALREVAIADRARVPDLTAREWPAIGIAHRDTYKSAFWSRRSSKL